MKAGRRCAGFYRLNEYLSPGHNQGSKSHAGGDDVSRAGKVIRKGSGSVEITELSSGYISHARTVLRHAPDKATLVRAGTEKLDAAYKEVIQAFGSHPQRLLDDGHGRAQLPRDRGDPPDPGVQGL